MKIKSYYSRTVQDAIAMARQELGPEAMLVNSRRSLMSWGSRCWKIAAIRPSFDPKW